MKNHFSKLCKSFCSLTGVMGEKATVKSSDFYKLAPTCQIPNLSHIYEMYFGKKRNGVFVEFGAYDGEYVSNTSGLADIGWTGYYLEPIPEFYNLCLERHKKNKKTSVVNVGIGSENKYVRINVSGPLSTMDLKTKNQFKSLPWSKELMTEKSLEVKQITLESFLIKEGIKKDFELLVIDVEGYEWNTLKNFRIQDWSPQMVIIELHDHNKDYPHLKSNCDKIVNYFESNDYRVIYKDFTNTIYVKK